MFFLPLCCLVLFYNIFPASISVVSIHMKKGKKMEKKMLPMRTGFFLYTLRMYGTVCGYVYRLIIYSHFTSIHNTTALTYHLSGLASFPTVSIASSVYEQLIYFPCLFLYVCSFPLISLLSLFLVFFLPFFVLYLSFTHSFPSFNLFYNFSVKFSSFPFLPSTHI